MIQLVSVIVIWFIAISKSPVSSKKSYLLRINGGYEPTPYDRRSERGTIDIDTDMGKTGSIVLGKDRVLVQFNMDLKWIYLLITDKNEWSKTFEKFITFLQTNCIHRFSKKKILKKEILHILSDIRFKNPTSTYPLKCFYGTLEETLQYSYIHNKLLLMYIEDGYGEFPTQFSSTFRRALSNSKVSHLINEKFIFYAVTTKSHYYFKKIYQMYNKLPKFPILLVITPFDINTAASSTTSSTLSTTTTYPSPPPDSSSSSSSSSSMGYRKRITDDTIDSKKNNQDGKKPPSLSLLEICNKIENNLFAAVLLPPPELNGENILHFLHSILDNLGIRYNSQSFFKDSLNFLKATSSNTNDSSSSSSSSGSNSYIGDDSIDDSNMIDAKLSSSISSSSSIAKSEVFTTTTTTTTPTATVDTESQHNNIDDDDYYDECDSPTHSSMSSMNNNNKMKNTFIKTDDKNIPNRDGKNIPNRDDKNIPNRDDKNIPNRDDKNIPSSNGFSDFAHLFFPKK